MGIFTRTLPCGCQEEISTHEPASGQPTVRRCPTHGGKVYVVMDYFTNVPLGVYTSLSNATRRAQEWPRWFVAEFTCDGELAKQTMMTIVAEKEPTEPAEGPG